MDIFTILFYQPIYNLVIVLYRVFGGDLGLAIIAIAFLSRLVTIPITQRQMKMAEKSKEMNDKMKEIKQKHKNDQEKQNQEMAALSAEYMPQQIAGCLPFIVQMILLFNIYHVVDNLIKSPASFNEVAYSFIPQFAPDQPINRMFLGLIDLGQSPAGIGYSNIMAVLPYIILAVLVVGSQYFSMRVMMGKNKAKEEKNKTDNKNEKKNKEKGKSSDEDPKQEFSDILEQSTKQTMLLLPVMLGLASLNFAAGLGLYWTVQSGFVIIQQFITAKLSERKKE